MSPSMQSLLIQAQAAVYSSFQQALESGASALASEYSSILATNSLPPMTSSTNVGGGAPGQTNNRPAGAAMPAATPFVGAAGMVAGAAGIAAMMI